jgi:hypothetical protein
MDDDTESIARAVPEAALICRGSRVFVATQVLKESVSRLDWARSRQRRQCNPTRRKREKPVSRKLFHGPRLAYVASSYHAGEGATATLARRREKKGKATVWEPTARRGRRHVGCRRARRGTIGKLRGCRRPKLLLLDPLGRRWGQTPTADGSGRDDLPPPPALAAGKGRAETTIEGREKGCITLQLSFCLHFVQRETGRVNGV